MLTTVVSVFVFDVLAYASSGERFSEEHFVCRLSIIFKLPLVFTDIRGH